MMMRLLFVFCVLFTIARAKIYFRETFSDDSWSSRWIQSNWKKNNGEAGSFKLTHGAFYGDKDIDMGIQTSQDARFYGYTAKMDEVFNNKGKDLVLQFSVKHEQKIDCGGGYIKLTPPGTDQATFSGDSQYNIMFGPDICGSSTRKVHVIFNYKGQNKLIKKDIICETDTLTHVYTLIVHPDQTYEVRIDGKKKDSGSFADDWDFLPAKMIKDPSVSKPADWVDEAMIDDPSDVKPADWDLTPKMIPDPEAIKPEDWDDEADGDWEAPMIENPEYKGEWKAKRIANPAYKGAWVHPEIQNPEYKEDNEIYAYESQFIAFDLWQVKAGSIFDNIIVSDSVQDAEEFMASTYGVTHEKEKKMFDDAENAKREQEEAERKAREAEEAKKREAEEEDDEEEEEDNKDEL